MFVAEQEPNTLTLLREIFFGNTSVCVEVIINTVITVGWTPASALAILRQMDIFDMERAGSDYSDNRGEEKIIYTDCWRNLLRSIQHLAPRVLLSEFFDHPP